LRQLEVRNGVHEVAMHRALRTAQAVAEQAIELLERRLRYDQFFAG
jgi:hypothetical protein